MIGGSLDPPQFETMVSLGIVIFKSILLLAFIVREVIVAFKEKDYWHIVYGVIASFLLILLLHYGLKEVGV